MPSFYFRKLVRDQVLQRCLDDPKVKTEYRILDTDEYKKRLVAKLHEESEEVPVIAEATDEVLSEIADVQAVLDGLAKAYGYTKDDILNAQTRKAAKNGEFEKRAYIEKVDLDDDSEWVNYFRQTPEKYEEIF